MLRRFLVGVTFLIGLSLGSAGAQTGGFCSKFDSGIDGWGPCASAPNITVIPTTDSGGITPTDTYLKLTDLSGASAACTTDAKYLGDWNAKMAGCGQFCFDFKVFNSGSPPSAITPSFTIYGPGISKATFVASFIVPIGDSTWHQHICAPIALGASPPTSPNGHWVISGGSWNSIITGVTRVSLPVDFSSSPSEVVGYDNLCMTPGDCGVKQPPEVTGCLKDIKVDVKCNPDGTYTVTLSGAGFSGSDITLTSQTSGVTVTPPQQPWAATTTWIVSGATPGQTVVLTANATKVGGGSAAGTDQCCSGEIKIVMPDCPKPIDLKIGKENTGQGGSGTWFNLWVTNVGAPITFPAGGLTVTDVIPHNMTVSSVVSPPGWTCAPTALVGPGTITCTYNLAGSLATGAVLPGTIMVHYTTTGPGPFTNCAKVAISSAVGVDSNPSNDQACVTVTGTDGKIDLAVVKTGGTSPVPQVNGYAFHLAVTSVGTPFNGTNVIKVTDVVPAGMTFNSATGTNWTCIPLPAAAGSTITCTYTGAGPTAPNQSLGTIDIVATAMGAAPFPPFTNCAQVGLKPGSGLSDVNPPNDKSCVTVSKPGVCPPPMVPGPVAGQCICPPGTHQVGNKCEGPPPPPSCQPPMVPGPVAGQCICPPPTVLKGKECVRPIECRSPLIPNASGTACGCPAGLEQRGRECVKPTVCNPPAKLNRRGACECPTDMVARGNSCVERDRPRPQISPGDIIRNIPGGGRDEPRGGRDTDSPRGGGQGPADFPGKR